MWGGEDYQHIILVGMESIQHVGLYHLIYEMALITDKEFSFINSYEEWHAKMPFLQDIYLDTLIFCFSPEQNFPVWLVTLLASFQLHVRRIVIFVDERKNNVRVTQLLHRIMWVDIFDDYSSIKDLNTAIKDKGQYYWKRSHLLLSQQEFTVLEGFVQGLSAHQQANKLGVKVSTVYQHRHNCAVKMGLKNLKVLFLI